MCVHTHIDIKIYYIDCPVLDCLKVRIVYQFYKKNVQVLLRVIEDSCRKRQRTTAGIYDMRHQPFQPEEKISKQLTQQTESKADTRCEKTTQSNCHCYKTVEMSS